MLKSANARVIFEVARTNLDRVPLAGETTKRDEDVLESPSQTVSDEALLGYINDGQTQMVEEVKAQYLQGLITTYSGVLSGLDQKKMVRPLVGRVERNDGGTYQICTYRPIAEHNYLESSGREATPKNPVYTYDGGKLEVYPGSDPDVRIDYVAYPSDLTTSDVPSDTWYVSGSDDLAVGAVLTGPLAMYVTAKAQRSIERYGLHDLYMQLYRRLYQPFKRTWRLGRPEEYGRSRVDEPEVNTEV